MSSEKKAAMEFFDKKVHEENLNVEFHSVENHYYCMIFPDPEIDENGIYKGFSKENIYIKHSIMLIKNINVRNRTMIC